MLQGLWMTWCPLFFPPQDQDFSRVCGWVSCVSVCEAPQLLASLFCSVIDLVKSGWKVYFAGCSSRSGIKTFFWLLEGTNGKGLLRGYSASSKQHEQCKVVNDGARRGVPLPDFKFVNDIQDSEEAKLEVKKLFKVSKRNYCIFLLLYCLLHSLYSLEMEKAWKTNSITPSV